MVADSEHVLVLRDQDTLADLRARLPDARRVVLVGNGGIALELVHALRGIEVSAAPWSCTFVPCELTACCLLDFKPAP